ncbi:lysophospholipid acyltransferase family protein [bacterium]|nr:lysophospholipid acyltransferase family protein [bacterium]MBU1633825.1 lysophospholipid acyltransferase family protein [bacterium]MBU1872912.1 lysophospholipid acyltransferase family protein [bacterium]
MSVTKITSEYRFEYSVLSLLNQLLPRLSHLNRRRIATILGYVLFYIIPYRKKVVVENLAKAFPDKPPGWRRKLAKQSYIHFARFHFDIFSNYQLSEQRFKRMVRRIDNAHLDNAIRQGKGVLIILFHFGNWELIADWLARNHYNVAAIAARLANPLADRLVTEIRTKNGLKILPKGRRHTVKTYRFLKNDQLLYMVADQNAGKQGAWVRFFDQWSSSFRGPMLFALRKKCPVLLASCLMDEKGRYDIRFDKFPLETPAGLPEDKKIEFLIQSYTRYFEELIRQKPEQYYWIHRRWKSKILQSLIKEIV